MSVKIKINEVAYRKMGLHSLKYITEDVHGILVGTVNQNNIQVQDAYPLFHSKFLTPLLETAFEFVDAIASKKNQVIVGWYESCVKNNDNATDVITDVSHEVVENISSKIPFPLLLSIKEITVEDPEQPNNLEVRALLGKTGGAAGYEFQNVSPCIENKLDVSALEQDLNAEHHLKLIDFQTHLSNPEFDFRNEFIH